VRRVVPFLTLETATLLSGTGNAVVGVALPWLILERTGSPTAAGVVAAATALPMLASALFSGTLVDIVGRRRMAVLSDLASGLSLAAIPLLDHAGGLTVATLALLAVLGAVFDPAGVSARETMLPSAARAGGLPLERVNGVHEAVWNIAFLLGPGIGGVLIATVGASDTLWAAAAGFALSSLLITTLRLADAGRPPEHERPKGVWTGTKEGLAFVWRDPLLRAVAIFGTLIIAVYLPIEGVVLPVYFQDQDAPERLGALVMAISGGAVAGALAYAALGAGRRRALVFRVAFVAVGILILALAALPPFPAMLVIGVAIGVAYGPVGPIINIAMQERTPEALRGRVVGVITSVGFAAGPAGYLLAGPLVDRFGVQATFTVLAVGLLALGLASLTVRSLGHLDDDPSVRPDRSAVVTPEPTLGGTLAARAHATETQDL
jgi:MFS family permease